MASATPNVVPLVVDAGTPCRLSTNLPFVSVTVCTPGDTTSCQTIDHVILDTGSTGLRLMAPVTAPGLALASVSGAAANSVVAQCYEFLSATFWGPVKKADVFFGGEMLASMPIQLVGDTRFTAPVPSDCNGTPYTSVNALGANGILGVATPTADCGNACAISTAASFYYQCLNNSCTNQLMPVAAQIPNPVSKLSTDNNGVIVQLPAIPATGAPTATGSLILGIGTRANNAFTGTTRLTMSSSGLVTTTYKGRTFTYSFFDTGSNFFFFSDSTLAQCTSGTFAGFYCPATTTAASPTVTGLNGATLSAPFSVANASIWLTAQNAAYSNLAAVDSSTFDFGLPFYYGKSVYTAFQGRTVAGTAGPWIAF